ncbi:MAG: sigma-70 family RNA polymerase sigma factor [Planctomycetes bacterium]|nr:sigma-70 family RNA polymerase sigma factor [Planctomycetota bacterium]
MGQRWQIRIGTRTTPRKQSAIKAAREGRMLTRHWDYVKPIYIASLYRPLQDILPRAIPSNDLAQFAEECIEDAFVRIKEYEEGRYKFRTFLVQKVVFPRLAEFIRGRKNRHDKLPDENELYSLARMNDFSGDFRYHALKQFVDEALRELKKDNEVQYEVVVRKIYRDMQQGEIYKELKDQYTLSLNSADAVKKANQRGLEKLKHYLREIYKRGKYVDKERPLQKWFLARLRAETTAKK